MSYTRLSEVVLFVFIKGLISCSPAQQKSTSFQTIPLSELSHQVIGEQEKVIDAFGLPDTAHRVSLGVTTWIYCSKSPYPVYIQFDSAGAIMNRFNTFDSNCSTVQTESASH